MLPPPKSIASLGAEEFLAALEYANMVAGHEFLEEIPAIGKLLIRTENRFALAIAKHFRNQRDKIQSVMWRWWAFQKVHKHRSMKKYIRGTGEEQEIHHAVFEVVATQRLSERYEFRAKPFFEEVRRVAARMDADEAKAI